jgi:hypothetical protein
VDNSYQNRVKEKELILGSHSTVRGLQFTITWYIFYEELEERTLKVPNIEK